MQGWRAEMEDAHFAKFNICEDIEDVNIFGVLDGHHGKEVAAFVANHFVDYLVSNSNFKQGLYAQSLKDTFLKMDELLTNPESQIELMRLSGKFNTMSDDKLKQSHRRHGFTTKAGCTACIALILGDRIFVSNSGDARCVISSEAKAVQVTVDHKIRLQSEKERILKAGGHIIRGRVEGNLNVTRAIGDLKLKRNMAIPPEEQMISAVPDVFERRIMPEDEFLMLGCDGVFDTWKNQQIVDYVRDNMQEEEKISVVIEKLLDQIVAKKVDDSHRSIGTDNMTCVIIPLNRGNEVSRETASRQPTSQIAKAATDTPLFEMMVRVH